MVFEEHDGGGGVSHQQRRDGLAALVSIEVDDVAAVGESNEVVKAGAIHYFYVVVVAGYLSFELEC